jgi:hypothetical protein
LPSASLADTRQRGKLFAECHLICSTKGYTLPSAIASALGKEATFVECLLVHSAKVLTKGPTGDLVAECWSGGYSAKRETLCRVSPNTLGKWILFAECRLVHSAKAPSPLPSAVMATFLCRVPSDTRQKYSAKKPLPMYSSTSFFAECHTR